jgi:hypothetical protein
MATENDTKASYESRSIAGLVIVTHHAADRMKSRIGIPKKAIQRTAEAAFENGVTHKAAKGRLKKWYSKLFREHKTANNVRTFGKHVYIFSNRTLITVIHLPHNLEKLASVSR